MNVGQVTLDITLFIRLLEIAREELKTDADLHYLVDRVTTAQAHSPMLTMSNYAEIVPQTTLVATDRVRIEEQIDELSTLIEKLEDAGQSTHHLVTKRQALLKKLASPTLTAADADDKVSENITLSGSEEAVDRVKALLAMISINGNEGHSGVFAISWDGDGQDKIDVSFDIAPYTDLVHELSAYAGPVEMIGDNRTGFIGRPAKDGTPYVSYKKVFPVQTKINAATRLIRNV